MKIKTDPNLDSQTGTNDASFLLENLQPVTSLRMREVGTEVREAHTNYAVALQVGHS